jgi:hypothetical protein
LDPELVVHLLDADAVTRDVIHDAARLEIPDPSLECHLAVLDAHGQPAGIYAGTLRQLVADVFSDSLIGTGVVLRGQTEEGRGRQSRFAPLEATRDLAPPL